VIAIRSWGVFTARPPLVGQFTQAMPAAQARTAHAPGPTPLLDARAAGRVDPVTGSCGGGDLGGHSDGAVRGVSAWAVRGATGALAVGVFRSCLVSTQRAAVVNVEWNPYFAMFWFAASCMIAWRVGRGSGFGGGPCWWSLRRRGTEPLEFTLPSVVLVVVSPALGISSRRLRRTRGPGGYGARWSVPGSVSARRSGRHVVAEASGFTGEHEPASSIAYPVARNRQRFALHLLAWAVVPPPLWFHTSETVASQIFRDGGLRLPGPEWRARGAGSSRPGSWRAHPGTSRPEHTRVAGGRCGGVDRRASRLSGRVGTAYLDSCSGRSGCLVWGVAALGVREVVGYALAEVASRRGARSAAAERRGTPTRAALRHPYAALGRAMPSARGTHFWTWAACGLMWLYKGLIHDDRTGVVGTMSSANRRCASAAAPTRPWSGGARVA